MYNQRFVQTVLKRQNKSYTKPILEWKCTPGIGDLMYGMNVAHFKSFALQKPVDLYFNWYHGKDYLYHFEDPETIVERFEFIDKFYSKDRSEVRYHHNFNSGDTQLYAKRYKYFKHSRYCNEWLFRENKLKEVKNKIVFWRATFNAQVPREWKLPFENHQWKEVLHILEVKGYDVVEIDYRTPISEVFYHIATCEATLSYEGMWHYVAKNFNKPMIIVSNEPITTYHTPYAYRYFRNESKKYDTAFAAKDFKDFEEMLRQAKRLCIRRKLIENE